MNLNLPLTNDKNTPLVFQAQDFVPRSHTFSDQISKIAIDEFKKHGKGLKYVSSQDRGLAKSKEKAQYILKYHHRNGTLFTISDKRPQEYYPSCLDPKF